MKTHLRRLLSIGGLVAALTFPAGPAFAVSLDYTFTGQFFAGSLLDGVLVDGLEFEVHIIANTSVLDNDPADMQYGEFLGPFSAQIIIEGMGVHNFVNSISMITERTNGMGFQPVESRAVFGGGSTSSMTGFSPLVMSPFFGSPNLLDPFLGGANVVVADFNNEPVTALGSAVVVSLNAQSPGGSVSATEVPVGVPDSGSSLVMLGLAVAGFGSLAAAGKKESGGRKGIMI